MFAIKYFCFIFHEKITEFIRIRHGWLILLCPHEIYKNEEKYGKTWMLPYHKLSYWKIYYM
jgi:hypothetical protein